jgi:hypothetical protein
MRDLIRFDSSAFVGEDSDLYIPDKRIMNVCDLTFLGMNDPSEKRFWKNILG